LEASRLRSAFSATGGSDACNRSAALCRGLEELKQSLKILFALAMAAVTLWGYSVPPAANFPNHELARMIFFHLPCAITTCWFVFLAPYLAVRYLMTKDIEWDMRSASCNELGFLFAILTMATGIVFSKVQWGAWWNWDRGRLRSFSCC